MAELAELSRLPDYADDLLDLCTEALTATDAGIPERVYISAPGPAFDCEQLTVECRTLGDYPLPVTSTLGSGRRITAAINVVGFRITVVRCVQVMDDNGNPPDEAQERADARVLMKDLYAIWTRIRTAQRAGELFGGDCDHLFYDGAFPAEVEGGYAGYYIDFRVEIDGFANNGS